MPCSHRSVASAITLASALALLAGAESAHSQEVTLGEPTASFPEDFGLIQTVRELPDGRVLVADPLGKALYLVDMDAGTREVVGSEGRGPDEYLQPDAVWPLPGDSTLLVDLGNGRLVALGPDLSFGATMPIAMGEPAPGRPFVLALPQGVDRDGHIYARAMGGFGANLPDSAAILRIDRGTEAMDTVASFKLQERKRSTSGGPNNQNVRITQIPLSPEDAWGVAWDGSVAVVRSSDYHLEWIGADGRSRVGPPVPFRSVRIGTPEKEEYVAESARNGGGVQIGVEVNNGSMSMSFGRGGGGGREIDQYEWPKRKPPFYSGRLVIDPEHRAWVRRHVDAGDPSTYDVFDDEGTRVMTVTLGAGKRVIGFGARSVYVVSYDQFDLNYLERYELPST
jgi:hypothetical protein